MFRFQPPVKAERVSLIGSFNSWDAEKGYMKKVGDNVFEKEMFLQDGIYQYLFTTGEGFYYTDPTNIHKEINEYGGYNSVLYLGKKQPDIVQRLDRGADNEIVFKVKIARNKNADTLKVIINDKTIISMEKSFQDEEWTYFIGYLQAEDQEKGEIFYYYLLDNDCYLTNDEVSNSKPKLEECFYLKSWEQMYNRTPDWLKSAVLYQIFPDRFANGNPANDPVEVEEWGATPTLTSFFGGDLQGIIDHLDYIAAMGVDTIYLNPIFASPSCHGYDIADFYCIEPRLGDNAVWDQLLEAARERNIRIILDIVYNHTSTEFFAFKDLVAQGEASLYRDWYYVKKFPVIVKENPDYICWFDYQHMPKLNLDNPETKSYLLEATKYWLQRGIAGYRVDTLPEVPHSFWKEVHNTVKGFNQEACLIGEVWESGVPWLQGDEFDSITNYYFWENVTNCFATKKISLGELIEKLKRQIFDYPFENLLVQVNFLSSHDTVRFLTAVSGNKVIYLQAYEFLFAYPGAPLIYYGEEIGMQGGNDPDNRRCMIWDERLHDECIKEHFVRLIRLRKEYQPLQTGNIAFLDELTANNILALKRSVNGEEVYFFSNISDGDCTIDLSRYVPMNEYTQVIYPYPYPRKASRIITLNGHDSIYVYTKSRTRTHTQQMTC